MPDLKWQKVEIERKHRVCTPAQPSRDGTWYTACRSPSRDVLYGCDAGKSSELDDSWLHIESQVGKESHKVLAPKTTLVYHSCSNLVWSDVRVYNQEDAWATMDMQQLGDIHPQRKPGTTVQPSEVGAKPSSCKSPLRKVLDVEDADKSSNPVATGLQTDSKVGKESHKVFTAKTTPVCHRSKSGLLVNLREVLASRTNNALDMQEENNSLPCLLT